MHLNVERAPAGLRRQMRPLAWSVLEELILSAERHGAELASPLGARQVAEALGISKDTAARGISRLIEARLVRRETHRDAAGRFGASRYVLHLPSTLAPDQCGMPIAARPADRAADATRRRRPTSTKAKRSARQLSLMDGDG